MDGQASLLFGWLMQLQLYTSHYLSILSVNMVTIVLLLQQSVPEISIVQAKEYSPEAFRLLGCFPSFAARLSIRPVCLSSVILLQGLELLGCLSIRKLMHDSLLYPPQ